MEEEAKESSPAKKVVELAKQRFARCKEAYDATRLLSIEDTKFALGDSDNGWQWPDEIRTGRQGDKRPCLTVNLTAQHCNQIINNIRQNRPSSRVLPADSKSDKKSAEMMAGLLRNIQTASNADDAHDTAAEHSVYGGEGYWRILTEYESPESFTQVIKIKTISNPLLVYIDCDAVELDKSDAEYGFIFEDVTIEQCKEDHPGVDVGSWVDDKKSGWVTKDTIRRAEYFYLEKTKDILCLMPDGTTVMESEMPGAKEVATQTRPTTKRQWKWCKLVGGSDEPLDTKDWAGSYLPIVACVGKEVNVNGEIVRKGIVRDLKDPARMVNYSYSAAIETVALQNKVPYIAAKEAVEGYEKEWKNANGTNYAYLPYNAFGDDGQAIPVPQRQQGAVMPAAQVQMLQLSTEEMRAASGQQNANFGIKSEAASGVGIQRLKVQGETATFHFPDNLVRALRYEAKILIDLIPKIYDTRRVVRILGLDGKEEQAILDPDHQGPSADVQMEGDISKLFNPTLGAYDVVIDTGPSFHTQRQEAAANLTELASKYPPLMQVAGDIVMRSFDFPMADELAKRLEKTVPPELQDQKDGQEIPPQVQAAMQQMGQQIEQMGQALQEAQQTAQQAEQARMRAEAQAAKASIQASQKELENNVLQARSELATEAQSLVPQDEMAKQEMQNHLQVVLKEMDITANRELELIRVAADVLKASAAPQAEGEPVEPEASQMDQLAPIMEQIAGLAHALAAPKRLIRDESGRAVGVETVM